MLLYQNQIRYRTRKKKTRKEENLWSSDNLYNPGDVLYHKASLKRIVIVREHSPSEGYVVSDGEHEFFVKEFELQLEGKSSEN